MLNKIYQNLIGALGAILYLAICIFQYAAVKGCIEDILNLWGWPSWISFFIALPLACTPIVGMILGIMGAIKSFGWTPLAAIVLVFFQYIILLIVFVINAAFKSDRY